ncbi:DUF4167 domain-containing protein [Rhizobium sp. SSA_523]|uniref:DUF4167 domain-containing protein n=1 Tax=Rhizobium sp. SSA_523 TaxID=2952477 RepID=UPI002090B210|nr:DUF4167 domain-containing protein [Rhizobium sp. SSA_523]MCO5733714.1 DUF4167 domain-containing protein [Rhizobium sp. SSA_523]WKC22999.1 DUF4167 domain-containing protein [Rhizobium sp. SSA_523]
MRPGQQNKRGRGRGSNNNNNGGGGGGNNFNRKGSNPLTRTYDSSGPDIKIRGTAQHIAEKYATLARDAQSAGDRVMAENYLQHAEHYNRIIAAAQAQMQERFQRDERHDSADRDGDDMDGMDGDDNGFVQQSSQAPSASSASGAPAAQQAPAAQSPAERAPAAKAPAERAPASHQSPAPRRREAVAQPAAVVDDGSGPQPIIEGTPAEVAIEEEGAAAAAPRERQPRRRSPSNRPRRTRRTADGEGETTAGDDAPALAEAGE